MDRGRPELHLERCTTRWRGQHTGIVPRLLRCLLTLCVLHVVAEHLLHHARARQVLDRLHKRPYGARLPCTRGARQEHAQGLQPSRRGALLLLLPEGSTLALVMQHDVVSEGLPGIQLVSRHSFHLAPHSLVAPPVLRSLQGLREAWLDKVPRFPVEAWRIQVSTEARAPRLRSAGSHNAVLGRGCRRSSTESLLRRQAGPALLRACSVAQPVVEAGLAIIVPRLLDLCSGVVVFVRVSCSAVGLPVRPVAVATRPCPSRVLFLLSTRPTLLQARLPLLVLQPHGPPRREEHPPVTHLVFRVLAQDLHQRLVEVWVPAVVLLAHPGRHPL